jgi:osmotically-inducible protein OsmY
VAPGGLSSAPRRGGPNVTRIPHRIAALWLAALPLIAVLPACTPQGMALNAGTSAATAGQSEAGIKQTLTDTRILAEINHYLLQRDHVLFGAVSVTVTEARVLLTGAVETPESRIEASRLAWQAGGVQEVINEVQVRDSSSLADRAKDRWITTELRSNLLFDKDVASINFSIDTVNAVVYLFGIARNDSELNRVVNHARNLKGVDNVVSYIRVR